METTPETAIQQEIARLRSELSELRELIRERRLTGQPPPKARRTASSDPKRTDRTDS